ncbi:MAG TPA: hypothetical protein VFI60_05565 [Candidatus Acidoferrum sp.]|nr:hypothetical protein [Candidatus Acidoferrum sp.]
MNDAKHTKGPWKQGDGKRWDSHAIFTDDGTGFNGSGRFIARCEGATSGFDNEANARLIAAAPDLLEALTAIRARISGEWDNPALLKFGPLSDMTSDIQIIARTAIAKAEGRS